MSIIYRILWCLALELVNWRNVEPNPKEIRNYIRNNQITMIDKIARSKCYRWLPKSKNVPHWHCIWTGDHAPFWTSHCRKYLKEIRVSFQWINYSNIYCLPWIISWPEHASICYRYAIWRWTCCIEVRNLKIWKNVIALTGRTWSSGTAHPASSLRISELEFITLC